MGFSFGGKPSKSQPSDISKTVSGALLELIPGLAGISLVDQDLGGEEFQRLAEQRGVPVEQVLSEFRQGMPSLQDLQNYQTIFEKYASGGATPFEQEIFSSLLGTIKGTEGGIGGIPGGGISTPAMPTFTPPPDIGTLTSGIMKNLPPQMQDFINNIFQDSSQEAIDRELDNFSAKMLDEASRNAESLGAQLLSQFSAMGLGTGGSAMNAMKQVAVETAINANAQIAQARLNMLNTLLNARKIGVDLINVLGQLGAEEQAHLVAGKVAELNAQADIIQSQIAAQAQMQSALMETSARLQLGRMSLLGDVFGQVIGESAREEEARRQGQLLPFQILQSLATGVPALQTGPTQPSGIGGVGEFLGGLGTLIGATKHKGASSALASLAGLAMLG